LIDSFAVYIHLPYCKKKCPYCDFNSWEASSLEKLEAPYLGALCQELSNSKETFTGQVSSIFFGGGTPSLFSPASIAEIIETVKRNFKVTNGVEITLEANPGSLYELNSVDKLKGFRAAGVNRISLGVQGFSDEKLKFLGRIHSGDDAVASVKNIKAAGFQNFNIDLMFGCKDESLSSWQTDLDKALSFSPPHISTAFGRLEKKGTNLVSSEEVQAEMFELAGAALLKQGLVRYEVSNFARPGSECLHNLNYWQGRSFLGVGAGAHSSWVANSLALSSSCSKKETKRWRNNLNPKKYIEQIGDKGFAKISEETLSQEAQANELVLLNMRTKWGMDKKTYLAHFSEENLYKEKLNGLLEMTDNRVTLSEKGYLFSNTVFEELTE